MCSGTFSFQYAHLSPLRGVQATYVNIISYKCVFNGFNSPLPAVFLAIL